MKLVLKIGGSVLFDEQGDPDPRKIREFIEIIKQVHARVESLAIVVGGGKTARKYVRTASEIGLISNAEKDQLGIMASRMNAQLLISSLKSLAYQGIPTSYEDLAYAYSSGRIVILGGLQPAQSTNAVAALTAEFIKADLLLNVTNVPGVFDSDPRTNPDARLYSTLSYDELLNIISQKAETPASYDLFDVVGLSIVKRSNITLRFISGDPPQNILDVLEGKPLGTLVSSSPSR